VDILRLLRKRGATVKVYDPFVESIDLDSERVTSAKSVETSVDEADCIIIATAHKAFAEVDLRKLIRRMHRNPILFDTRNILLRKTVENAGFRYLGTGRP
ncbi:MAG TPA: UDP-glucose/GDP-mannose dehydrogenase family protein, partial [Candidatus Binatus sp.]|nr:UDP-glucose/GDP-mannose dehydrogenase family protein [Candidatus Binatus sp.]